jgi:hypothetical protein
MKRRNPWMVVGAGLFGLAFILIAGVAGYWRYANQLPAYPAPEIVMPAPNAYDDYVAAGQLCKAAGGAALPVPPVPHPARQASTGPGGPPGFSGGPGPYPGQPGYASGASAPSAGPVVPTPSTHRGPLQAFDPDAPLAQVREIVRRNQPALARLRVGFRKQYRCPPIVSFSRMFPELANYRELARVLATEGKLAEREGRYRDAMRSYLDCLRLGVNVPRGGDLSYGLVGEAIEDIGLKQVQAVAGRLDGPTAAAAAREMALLDAHAPGLAEALTNEKDTMTANLLQTLGQARGWQQFTGMAYTGSSGAPTGADMLLALRFSFYPKRVMFDHIRGYMDALAADARRPYYARTAPPPLPTDPLSQIVLPVFTSSRLVWAKRDAQWRIAELRLATQAYERAHGAPLPSLEALAPAYLPAAPQDPFAPKPMVYHSTGGGARLYSRGPDGKDDGGKDLGRDAQPGMSGDIASMKSSRSR